MKNIYTQSRARYLSEIETPDTVINYNLDYLLTSDEMIEDLHAANGDVTYIVPANIEIPAAEDVIAVYFHDWAGCIQGSRTNLIDFLPSLNGGDSYR